MAVPFIGEIRMFAGNFPPYGWAFCDGQELPIYENETLFTLIGTTYGGDGENTFRLPDMRGRLPMHQGTGSSGNTYTLAETGGSESVVLTMQQIPAHSHKFMATNDIANTTSPSNSMLAVPASTYAFVSSDIVDRMKPMMSITGGSQPHENMQPYVCVSFIISLFGLFPNN